MVRRVFLAFLVFSLVACGDDGVSSEVTIIGTWEFESITSASGTATAEPSTWTFTATTLTIVLDDTDCTGTASYTFVDGTLTFTVTTVNGSECDEDVSTVGDVEMVQATVTADTLTLVFEILSTVTVVFRRVN